MTAGRRCALLAWVFTLSACASAPLAPAPVLPTPAAWQTGGSESVVPDAAGEFWMRFGNAALLALLQQAAAANPDLLIATQRLRLGRDAELEAGALQQPSLSLNAGPVDSAAVAVRDRSGRNPTIYRLGLNASYELDFWGRVSGLVSSAEAESMARGYDLETARILLATQVAQHFFDIAEADEQRGLLQQRSVLAEQRLALETARQDAGRIDRQPVAAAQQALGLLQAQQREWQRQRQRSEWRLALLCGQLPEGYSIGPQALRGIVQPTVPAGLPSTLLQRRPDLRAAAARLQAAQAQIGVARAEQFPQFRLTAELGLATDLLHRALSGSVGLFGIGPEISLPLYDGGARAARLDARQREAEIALLEYRKAGLAAFSDVEQALQARQAAVEQQQALLATQARQQAELKAAVEQLLAGRKSRLDMLAAEDAQLESAQQAIRNTRAQLDSALALHAALGGSWQAVPPLVAVPSKTVGASP